MNRAVHGGTGWIFLSLNYFSMILSVWFKIAYIGAASVVPAAELAAAA
jgi:hypothetical protein